MPCKYLIYKAFIFNLSGVQGSNLRPPGPKPGALTGLRYTPRWVWACLRQAGVSVGVGVGVNY